MKRMTREWIRKAEDGTQLILEERKLQVAALLCGEEGRCRAGQQAGAYRLGGVAAAGEVH